MGKPIKKTDQKKAWNRKKEAYLQKLSPFLRKFLIICEGANTEPLYFSSFPQTTVHVITYGTGTSKTTLVNNAIAAKKQVNEPSRETWVVFDMDIKPDQLSQQKEDYNRAIDLAQKHGIKAAVSNDAFELWFVLHFQDVTAAMHRDQYYQILSKQLNISYKNIGKNYEYSQKLYTTFQNHPDASLPDALRRAKRLHDAHIAEGHPPADQNPCTTVYALVCALLEGETDCPAVCAEA